MTTNQTIPTRRRRIVRVTAWSAAVFTLSAAAVAATSPAASAQASTPAQTSERTETHELTFTGADQSLVTPAWARTAQITAIGAAGGSTCSPGGAGTQVAGALSLDGGELLSVGVGGKGGTYYHTGGGEMSATGGWGGAGTTGGNVGLAYTIGTGAAGGGGTTVSLDGAELIVAGGGGGAGMCHDGDGGDGGSAGPGQAGDSYLGADGGSGGHFASAPGRAGQKAGNAGGGGGGYVGGGYGSSGTYAFLYEAGAGGGGAGSSWTAPERLRDVSTTTTQAGGNGSVRVTFSAERTLPHLTVFASHVSLGVGQTPVLTATLPADATGSIGFYDHSIAGPDQGIGVAPIIDGKAVLLAPTRPFELGAHPISASFGGDDRYAANDSDVVTVTVKQDATAWLQLANTSMHQVSWLVYVPETATGTVTFYDDSNSGRAVGTAAVSGGKAHLFGTVSQPLFMGEHHIRAEYSGDGTFLPATSNTVVVRL